MRMANTKLSANAVSRRTPRADTRDRQGAAELYPSCTTPRVVRQKNMAIKSRRTRNQGWLCWRGPAAIYPTERPTCRTVAPFTLRLCRLLAIPLSILNLRRGHRKEHSWRPRETCQKCLKSVEWKSGYKWWLASDQVGRGHGLRHYVCICHETGETTNTVFKNRRDIGQISNPVIIRPRYSLPYEQEHLSTSVTKFREYLSGFSMGNDKKGETHRITNEEVVCVLLSVHIFHLQQ
jgi:hypothetical protein